jgi:hypothetical protein
MPIQGAAAVGEPVPGTYLKPPPGLRGQASASKEDWACLPMNSTKAAVPDTTRRAPAIKGATTINFFINQARPRSTHPPQRGLHGAERSRIAHPK